MHDTLTSLQAYSAMLCFLENYYNKTLSDDLGSLLGDLQLCGDNKPFDPAAWHDWIKALGTQHSITSLDAFKAMISFLNDYYERTLSDDIKALLDDIQDKKIEEGSSVEWIYWMKCVNIASQN
jgi:hypothetical protein